MATIVFGAKAKRSKYGVRTDAIGKAERTVDGVLFDSKKEAKHYQDLKLRRQIGEIDTLVLQPAFKLTTGGVILGRYKGDFSYRDLKTGRTVVEDCKGVKTALYNWKKKHVEAQYGITIQEV